MSKRVIVFDYKSRYCKDIIKAIETYNSLFPEDPFKIDLYNALEHTAESIAGRADAIIHSGGDGRPVEEDLSVPKLYICHSHQWRAKKAGGEVVKLKGLVTGIQKIDIIEDDDILGEKGELPIMKYHEFAVTRPPENTKVLAKSRSTTQDGRDVEIIEALRYPDGAISVQGHPEEGTAFHIIRNFLKKIA